MKRYADRMGYLWAGIGLALLLVLVNGCSPKSAVLSDPAAPPAGYKRHIVVVVETKSFHPVPGAVVEVKAKEPTILVSPVDGMGRTDAQGALELIFEPLPHYDDAVLEGGDIVAEFPIVAEVTVEAPGKQRVSHVITDSETFARYADPFYHGLNRDPEAERTYFNILLP